MEKILNGIATQIDNITEACYLDKIIRRCEDRKKRLAEDKWEEIYKDRCKEYYVSLTNVLTDFWVINDGNTARELENYYYNYPHGLSSLLSQAKSLELKVPYNVGKMACSICICGGCIYQEECCGYTCETCKPHYTGYQWECEE